MKQQDILKELRIQKLKDTHAKIKSCVVCGNDMDRKANTCRDMELYIGLCMACKEKRRSEIYLQRPDKLKKHIAAMKIYHENTRHERVIRDGNKRGLGAEYFINKPFRGSAAHHMTITTIVYIPAWIHIELQHQHKFPDTLDVINKWSEKWLKFEQKHVDKSLQWKLVKFYRIFVTNVYK